MADHGPLVPEISVSRTSTDSRKSDQTDEQQQSSRKSSPSPLTRPNNGNKSRAASRKGYARWKWGKRDETWKRSLQDEPEWRMQWNANCFPNGRVLIIDYISHSTAPVDTNGRRPIRIQAQEFQQLSELHRFYSDPKRAHCAALRVIHVQNAPWATLFLLNKFNISHPSEMVGMQGFSKWARYEKPRQRNGKPVPNGRSWRGQTDPWRNLSRTAFGTDYLKPFSTTAPSRRAREEMPNRYLDAQAMHLNAYEDSRSPFGYDIAVQRLSVYVQRSLGPAALHLSPDVDVRNPYLTSRENDQAEKANQQKDILQYFDNGNTVVVFETSATGLLEDCLIQPRNDLENRWRRLPFYLKREDARNNSRLAAQCTNLIVSDVFHALREVWEHFLFCSSNHISMLEDKIYENPADESRAPELWTNQASWLKVEKILFVHSDLVKEMQSNMKGLAEADNDDTSVDVDWLASVPAEYDRLTHSVSESLVQPTNNLSDLMYKSVGIRDSRQSLQLGLSMWRLSWITFIFLPLTFVTGFFGMDVSLLQEYPNIGWFFLASAILLVLVLILWYAVKHSLQRSRQTPYERGLYENLFHHLEDEYPQLWTAQGALDSVEPQGMLQTVKWRLLKRWFSPERTINKKLYSSLAPDGESAELGAVDSFKRMLLLRWLPQMKQVYVEDAIQLVEQGSSSENLRYETSTIEALAKASTPLAVAEAEPAAAAPLALYGLRPLHIRERVGSPRSSEDRPSSRGSSGVMVEERNLSDSESDVGEGSSERHLPEQHSAATRRASS